MPNDNMVDYLLLGGEYHGEIISGYRTNAIELPKRALTTDWRDARPTDTVSDLVYRVAVYNHSNRLQYMIAACQPFESFDVESEIYKAQLPHLPESYTRRTNEDFLRYLRNEPSQK